MNKIANFNNSRQFLQRFRRARPNDVFFSLSTKWHDFAKSEFHWNQNGRFMASGMRWPYVTHSLAVCHQRTFVNSKGSTANEGLSNYRWSIGEYREIWSGADPEGPNWLLTESEIDSNGISIQTLRSSSGIYCATSKWLINTIIGLNLISWPLKLIQIIGLP